MMGGPYFLLAWVVGAFLSLVDGMIWAELGAAYPNAGGSYNFLKESYGKKWGSLMSFLYVWQTCLQAPLVAASGAIGFAGYCAFLLPLSAIEQKVISGSLIIVLTILLYRKIQEIGKIGIVMGVIVLITMLWIIAGGIMHHTISNNFMPDGNALKSPLFAAALGAASVKTIYSYLGYYNVCHLGGEIISPEKNIPRSIFISIFGIAILYLGMNISVVSVIPWQEAQNSTFVVSLFMEKLHGHTAAVAVTILILFVAISSLFAVLLGYSRVPYAAAIDGQFFPVFARLHPTKHFPHISLLFICGAAFVFSLLFKLSTVITAILAMRILVQFIGQAIGLLRLHKIGKRKNFSFKMPLFPLPVIAAIAVWLYIFYSTGQNFMLSGLVVIFTGVIVYFLSFGKKFISSSDSNQS
jgi:amino acid transporter